MSTETADVLNTMHYKGRVNGYCDCGNLLDTGGHCWRCEGPKLVETNERLTRELAEARAFGIEHQQRAKDMETDRDAALYRACQAERERDEARACVEECRAVTSVMSMTLTDLLTRIDPARTWLASLGDVGVADDGGEPPQMLDDIRAGTAACDEATAEIEALIRERDMERNAEIAWVAAELLAHGLPTGHGETVRELVGTLLGEVEEIRARRDAALALLRDLRIDIAAQYDPDDVLVMLDKIDALLARGDGA